MRQVKAMIVFIVLVIVVGVGCCWAAMDPMPGYCLTPEMHYSAACTPWVFGP